jgi:DNA ligase-1
MKSLPKLYKRTTTGKIQEWEIFIDGDSYWTVTGQAGGKKITNPPTVCVPKNVGKTNETSPEAQAELEAQAKWKKQTEKHYSETIEDVDEFKFVKVMLAKSYEDRKDKMVWDSALVSPKLDGIRFVAKKVDSHSRNGKSLGGGDVIRTILDPLFDKYPDLVLDGELYNHEFKDEFNTLVSLIKRDLDKTSDEKLEKILQHLQYHVYDMDVTSPDTYLTRYIRVKEIITKEFPDLLKYIKFVPYRPVSNHDEMIEYYTKFIGEGYEGAIIRYNAKYENKRTWNLLKVKEFDDDEFEIVRVIEGVGRRAGTAGAIEIRLKDGRTCNANIKGGYAFYDEIWEIRESLVGKSATVQFFGYTEYGVPRFPYVIKINREEYE